MTPKARIRRRMENLTWRMLDDELTTEQRIELEGLLAGDAALRRMFNEVLEMHMALNELLAEPAPASVAA